MKKRINIHSVKGIETRWNLNNPAHCRDFLKALRFDNGTKKGSKVVDLKQADGKTVTIDEASDEAIIELVNEIAQAMERANA